MEPSNGALIPASGLFSFGDNSEGNLGTSAAQGESTQSATPLPIEIALPVRFVSVAAGLYHTIALTGTSLVAPRHAAHGYSDVPVPTLPCKLAKTTLSSAAPFWCLGSLAQTCVFSVTNLFLSCVQLKERSGAGEGVKMDV